MSTFDEWWAAQPQLRVNSPDLRGHFERAYAAGQASRRLHRESVSAAPATCKRCRGTGQTSKGYEGFGPCSDCGGAGAAPATVQETPRVASGAPADADTSAGRGVEKSASREGAARQESNGGPSQAQRAPATERLPAPPPTETPVGEPGPFPREYWTRGIVAYHCGTCSEHWDRHTMVTHAGRLLCPARGQGSPRPLTEEARPAFDQALASAREAIRHGAERTVLVREGGRSYEQVVREPAPTPHGGEARRRAHEILRTGGATCGGSGRVASHGATCDRLTAALAAADEREAALKEERDAERQRAWLKYDELRVERDAYRKAKAENDERFMGERDAARRELADVNAALIAAREAHQVTVDSENAARRDLEAERAARAEDHARVMARVRESVPSGAEAYDTDWQRGWRAAVRQIESHVTALAAAPAVPQGKEPA